MTCVYMCTPPQAMLDVVGEMRHLCGLDATVSKSPVASKNTARGYGPKSVSPVGKGATRTNPVIYTAIWTRVLCGPSLLIPAGSGSKDWSGARETLSCCACCGLWGLALALW